MKRHLQVFYKNKILLDMINAEDNKTGLEILQEISWHENLPLKDLTIMEVR